MVSQETLNNITYAVVGGILSGMAVAVSFGQTLKLPSWSVALLGIIVVLLLFGLAKFLESLEINVYTKETSNKARIKHKEKTDWNKVNAISNISLSVLTFVAVLAVIGYFNAADIHPTRQINSHNECPQFVSGSFNLQFINLGNMGTSLCVNVFSKEINFSRNLDCSFLGQSTSVSFDYPLKSYFNPEWRT